MFTYDLSKVRGKVFEKFGSQRRFAEEINKSEKTISKKLHGKTFLNQSEIDIYCKALDIETNDIPQYFFIHEKQKVGFMATKVIVNVIGSVDREKLEEALKEFLLKVGDVNDKSVTTPERGTGENKRV